MKIRITIPVSLLPYFQRLAQNSLAPHCNIGTPTVGKLLLREWVVAKIQKLHPTDPKTAPKFSIRQSEAFAIFEALSSLQIQDILQDTDRNELINSIAKQLPPYLLNTSPV